ncbi:LETM1-domain-containing protein [Violaceomyces palustris]|uniref:LETM1-domain-containing protein n=1 Tax=Violaceomyces palustris TaxID=1673888 RepID=A0ACD0NY05_9BASI|nr:LETM1-domain-containing protein [Violaceomyces palustris]
MPSPATLSSLSKGSLFWATHSLTMAARSRLPQTGSPSSQLDVLSLFAPQLLTPSRRTKHTLAQKRRLIFSTSGSRFHSTETQQRSSTPSQPLPPHMTSTSSQTKRVIKPQSPPVPGLSSSEMGEKVIPVSPETSSELGSAANQASASQTELGEQQTKELEEVAPTKPKAPLTTRVWAKVKEEAAHYWHGTKLLAKEVRISSRLLRRLLLGYSLTRREHRQLKRTTADLLRLIPFVPFIIIPAGELLLPVAIKIFPNMLPSTFESKFAVEEKRRGLIKVRLEMAKFLQETIREGGLQEATDKIKTSDEFKEFFRKIRSTGESPSSEDVIKVAKLFDDDLTLDNLTRPQLVSMCRYMQINAFGTDNYLRYQIRHKLNRIRQDDLVISAEGLDGMVLTELVSACQNRGIQTTNLSRQRISGTLLVLSKAFNYVAQGSNEGSASHIKSLELTLSSLPDNLLNEAELNVNKEGATNKQRLEVLQQQEELIEDEAEQEQEEAAAREADKERKSAEKARLAQEERDAKAQLPSKETDSPVEEGRMTNEQLSELGEALSILSAKSSVLKEREELAKLIKEVSEDESVEVTSGAAPREVEKAVANLASKGLEDSEGSTSSSSSSSRSLAKKIKAMLEKIDQQLEEYDRDVGSRMHIIEASPTGKISVDDLEQALRLIKHKPADEDIIKFVDKVDSDSDGLISLQEVLDLAQVETALGVKKQETE